MAWDYVLQIISLGAALLGFVSGTLGSFAVLRKQSLLGDAISHAALPGIAIAFMIFLTKNPLVIIAGAFISGWIGTMIVLAITKTTKLKEDAALGIVLSVFFGFGVFLLTIIQRFPTSEKSGLDKFLFGSAATILKSDIIYISSFVFVILVLLLIFWKEFKIITFDLGFAQSIGIPVKFVTILLTTLIVISIVIGLQTVGVVLMSAMVIAPAVAARQWTDSLEIMVLLSGLFGALSGFLGAIISASIDKMPTGPTIVIIMGLIVLISLLFSPRRGLVSDWINKIINKKKINTSRTLYQLYKLSQDHDNPYHPHDIENISSTNTSALSTLKELESQGLVIHNRSKWQLTEKGLSASKKLGDGK